jgi:nucleoside-diphosphate-sugar epimerase
MRILMTGGSGVLGRASMPLLRQAGHQVDAPRHDQLDLYDPRAITAAARGTNAILHLASHTPPPQARGPRDAWAANDRLRRDATGILVDAALTTGVECFVFPSLAFIYPPAGPVDESTPLPEDVAGNSAIRVRVTVAC